MSLENSKIIILSLVGGILLVVIGLFWVNWLPEYWEPHSKLTVADHKDAEYISSGRRIVLSKVAEESAPKTPREALDPIVSVGPTWSIRGRVIARETGLPIAGASVALEKEEITKTDSKGFFAIESRNLAASKSYLRIKSTGFLVKHVVLSMASQQSLTVALVEAVHLSIKVTDRKNSPILGAAVSLQTNRPGSRLHGMGLSRLFVKTLDPTLPFEETNQYGIVTLDSSLNGNYVQVYAKGYVPVVIGPVVPDGDFFEFSVVVAMEEAETLVIEAIAPSGAPVKFGYVRITDLETGWTDWGPLSNGKREFFVSHQLDRIECVIHGTAYNQYNRKISTNTGRHIARLSGKEPTLLRLTYSPINDRSTAFIVFDPRSLYPARRTRTTLPESASYVHSMSGQLYLWSQATGLLTTGLIHPPMGQTSEVELKKASQSVDILVEGPSFEPGTGVRVEIFLDPNSLPWTKEVREVVRIMNMLQRIEFGYGQDMPDQLIHICNIAAEFLPEKLLDLPRAVYYGVVKDNSRLNLHVGNVDARRSEKVLKLTQMNSCSVRVQIISDPEVEIKVRNKVTLHNMDIGGIDSIESVSNIVTFENLRPGKYTVEVLPVPDGFVAHRIQAVSYPVTLRSEFITHVDAFLDADTTGLPIPKLIEFKGMMPSAIELIARESVRDSKSFIKSRLFRYPVHGSSLKMDLKKTDYIALALNDRGEVVSFFEIEALTKNITVPVGFALVRHNNKHVNLEALLPAGLQWSDVPWRRVSREDGVSFEGVPFGRYKLVDETGVRTVQVDQEEMVF